MLPLADRRILITRSRHQASELASSLEALGATTILLPTIEIAPPASFAPLDQAIADLSRFDWLVLTSVNAAQAFGRRLGNHDSHALAHIRTAAIGPATAHAAMEIGLKVALIPEKAVAESLTNALLPQIHPKTRILLVRAAIARDHLPDSLRAAGADVVIADAYQTVVPETSVAAVRHIFGDPARYPDAITFASSSTVSNLLALLETAKLTLAPSILRASIGPITSQTLCNEGFPPHIQSPEASIPSLAKSLAEYMASRR